MNIPISVEATNFLSFKSLKYDFVKGKTTLIQGKNFTDEGQESNGSGKSAFQQLIDYAVTGSTSRKVRDIKLIHYGERSATVVFTLRNIRNESTIVITRKIFKKSSSTLEITINGVDKKDDFATVPDGNKLIEQYIGISKADFHNFFIPNEVNHVSFFNSSDTKKKDLINRFSNASLLDGVEDLVQVDIDKLDQGIVDFERSGLKIEGQIELLQEQIQTELSRDLNKELQDKFDVIDEKIISEVENKQAKKERISFLKAETDTSEESLSLANGELNIISKELDKISKNLPIKQQEIDQIKLNSDETTSLKFELRDKRLPLNAKLGQYSEALAKVEKILLGTITCPKCEHKFIIKAEKSVEEYNALKQKVVNAISTLENSIQDISGKISDIDILLNGLDEKLSISSGEKTKIKNNIDKLKDDLFNCDSHILSIKDKQDRNESTIKSIESSIISIDQIIEELRELKAKLKKSGLSIDTSILDKQITEERIYYSEIEAKIAELQIQTTHKNEWKLNFTLFKSYLANKKLKVIEGLVNKYLEQMGGNVQVKIEGFKQLANKSIKEKITPYIFKNNELCEYGEFSKGERVRMDFATLLALQYLINESSDTGGLDLLFADEIGEGIDRLGLVNVLNSFNKSERTAFITSQLSVEKLYEHTLTFEKTNGISEIV